MYSLVLNNLESECCNGPNGLNEGIEFAVRVNTSGMFGPWVPLRWTWRGNNNQISQKFIRGYEVETHKVNEITAMQVTICEGDLLLLNTSEIQFRWMNSADQPGRSDLWALFNVTVIMINTNNAHTSKNM